MPSIRNAFLLNLACIALVFAACGGESSSAKSGDTPAVEPQQPAAAPSAPPAAAPEANVAPTPTPTPEPTAAQPVKQPEPSAAPHEQAAAKAPSGKAAPAIAEHTSPTPTTGATPTESAPAAPAAPVPSAAVVGPCGKDGQPSCPLQGFMERNLEKPLNAGDLARVAIGLNRIPALVPDPAWDSGPQGWTSLAQAAANAAKAGDAVALKQACKTCHKTWRSKYKTSFRLRPVPN
jgi:hypothetical protein